MALETSSNRTRTYGNPPVVELFAQVKFRPSSDKTGWSRESVESLLKRMNVSFGRRELVLRREVTVEEKEGDALPRIVRAEDSLDRVRVFSEDSSWCLQVGDDLLVCNVRKMGARVPTYTALRNRLEQTHTQYCQFYRPSAIDWIALNYVDLITIPEAQFELDEYFNLSLVTPDNYGPVGHMDFEVAFLVDANVRLAVSWRDVTEEKENVSFMVNWHMIDDEPCRVRGVFERMDRLHGAMSDYFEAALTDKCRALFQEG